jgi:hypothetical protein
VVENLIGMIHSAQTDRAQDKLARMTAAQATARFTRWVLLWFALSLGVAIASPLIRPVSMVMVCAGAGPMKMVALDDDGGSSDLLHSLDCPLCANLVAPPPDTVTALAAPHGAVRCALPVDQTQCASSLPQPWQARAPPALLYAIVFVAVYAVPERRCTLFIPDQE